MTAPICTDRARRLTARVFLDARSGDFHRAVRRVDEVLEEVRTEAYEQGQAAARREHVA